MREDFMITKDMTIMEVLQTNRNTAAVFASYNMGCIGCLAAHGETVEEAKARLAEEQYERTEKAKECKHTHVEIPDSKEIVKKNLEAAKKAGKR